MHTEYTGFRQIVSCNLKVKLYETSTNKASYIHWGPSNKLDLPETQYKHLNFSTSAMKTLASCDCSVTLHETKCLKRLSSVCLTHKTFWSVRHTVLLIGINISDNCAAFIFRIKPQVKHNRVHPNTGTNVPKYVIILKKAVIILKHSDIYYNADKKIQYAEWHSEK